MSCPFRDEVCLLADHGELDTTRRLIVEAHLGTCDSCARLEAANDIADQVLAGGDPQPLGVIDVALEHRPRRRPALAGIGVLAAAVLVALAIRPPTQVAPAEPAAAAAELPPLLVRETRLDRMLRSGDAAEVESALARAESAPSPWLASSVVALLGDERFAPRAARLLGSIGSVEAVPALEAALDGPAGVEAREALVAIGGDAAADSLERYAANDEGVLDALVRTDIVRGAFAVAEARSKKVLRRRRKVLLPEMRRLAHDEVAGAIWALGATGDRASIPVLAGLSRKDGVRDVATRALLALRDEEATDAAFQAVAKTGAPAACFDGASHAAPFLRLAFESGSFAERKTALELLGRCAGETVLPLVTAERLSRGLMPTAIDALARGGDKRSVTYLVDLVVKGRFEVEAGRALAGMPTAVVVPVLLENYDTRRVRRVLKRIAGADLGREIAPWQRWWKSVPNG